MKTFIVSIDSPFEKKLVGGKHIHILNFYNALKQMGNNYEVVIPRRRVKKSDPRVIASYILFLARKIFSGKWRLDNSRFVFRMEYLKNQLASQIRKILENCGGDDCIFIAEDIPSISAAVRAGMEKDRLFAVIHGYFTYEASDRGSLFGERSKSDFFEKEKSLYSKCSKIVAVDSAIKDYLITEMCVPEESIKVVYNAIDCKSFGTSFKDKEKYKMELVARLGLTQIKNVLLVPRRLVNKNGVIYAVKAMRELRCKNNAIYSKTVMLVCGDGPEKESIEQFIAQNGLKNVLLLGKVDHKSMVRIFKAADVVIIPSIYTGNFAEATSLAALEGMAARCYVIVSGVGGLKEIVKDGKTGAVVHDKSEKEIAEKIEYALNPKFDERVSKIADAANEYILKEHDYVDHAKKILSFFVQETKK